MKKRVNILLLALLLVMVGCSNDAEDVADSTTLEDGTYLSTQTGHNGPVEFEVVIADSEISAINLGEHFETIGISTKAIETDLPEAIIEKQSVEVDTITGATLSSLATIAAVKDAIEQAGGNVEDFAIAEEKGEPEEIEATADVVVIGGGGAGLAAAVTAANEGASVIIIEKSGYVGGNTMVSAGLMNGPNPELQGKEEMQPGHLEIWEELLAVEPISDEHEELQVVVREQFEEWKASGSTALLDTPEFYALQTWDGGDYVGNLDLIKKFTASATDGISWLKSLGWEDEGAIRTAAGALYPRTQKGIDTLGTGIIDTYLEHLDANDKVEIYLDNRATELVKNDAGRVVSVKSEDTDGNTYTFTANQGVLISTGGFGGNGELVQSFNTDGKWPDLSNRKTSNISTIEGDGIKMAQSIGAGVTGMEHIQLLFTTEPKTGQAGIANFSPLGTAGYLFVNQEGERFVREDGRRDEISLAMLKQTDQIGYMLQSASSSEIIHDETTDLNGVPLQPLIEQGYIHYGKTLEEAAEKARVPYETLQATIDSYNEAVESGAEEDEFGRHLLVNKLEGEGWYLVPRSPAIHHTMGGLLIDTEAHVLDENNEIIPGLYAAGEVAGGIHGANRLGGNAVTDTIVFGRTAGQSILNDSN